MGIAMEGGAAGDSDGDGHGWEAAGAWISDAAARSGTAADGAADRTAGSRGTAAACKPTGLGAVG